MDPFAGVSAGMDLMVGYLASLGPGRLIAGLPGQYPLARGPSGGSKGRVSRPRPSARCPAFGGTRVRRLTPFNGRIAGRPRH